MPRPAAAGGGSAGKNDFVADTNHAVGEDVGVDSSAVDQVFDDAGSGELLQVQAGFAEFDAQALDVADPKSLADQLVEAHTPGHNLTPGLRAAERDVLKRLGFDQRQRLTGRGPVVVEVAVALQTDTGDRGHRLDRRDRIARPDIYCLDLHGPASWDARRWIVRCRTPIMTAPAQPSQRIYGSLTCLDGRDGVPERSRRSALEPAHYRTYTHSLPLGDAPRRPPTGGTARSAGSSGSTRNCPTASTSSSSPVGRLPNPSTGSPPNQEAAHGPERDVGRKSAGHGVVGRESAVLAGCRAGPTLVDSRRGRAGAIDGGAGRHDREHCAALGAA